MNPPHNYELATLAGGCFWCLEAIYDDLKGVIQVESGYSGGTVANPSYEHVCSGLTGHAEVVQITFDPQVITFKELLQIFFTIHDPTTLNRQGADVGTQYRSAIFFHNDTQRQTAVQTMAEIKAEKIWNNPIVTQVVPFEAFYPAGDDHADYFRRNPNQGYCQVVIAPKVSKFRQKFTEKLKK